VLVVAVKGAINDWAAYIGAVQGENHQLECKEVADNGTKLPREIAEILFPEFDELEWRS